MADTPVYLEVGATRAFAVMVDWPGWARSGRTAQAALEALAAYQSRYAPVAARAGHPVPADVAAALTVVEELAGDATTDFGAPGRVPDLDRRAPPAVERDRIAALVGASWAELGDVVAAAPASLRKGPRGGGRDRDEVARHVLAAEVSYARRIGVRVREPALDDLEAVGEFRAAVLRALRAGDDAPGGVDSTAGSGVAGGTVAGGTVAGGALPGGAVAGGALAGGAAVAGGRRRAAPWPVRYAARRIAWHVLDHAWEIQDRSAP